MATAPRPSIFVSYSHKDVRWKNDIAIQLAALSESGICDFWDDDRIGVGQHWSEEIRDAMNRASVAVLLISAHFLTSSFIKSVEVPHLRALKERGLWIVPVIVSPCPWQRIGWISELQVCPRNGKSLSGLTKPRRDEVLAALAGEIGSYLDDLPNSSKSDEGSGRAVQDPAQGNFEGGTLRHEALAETRAIVQAVSEHATDPRISEIVASFDRELAVLIEQIRLIQTYKELHDELHRFEMEFLGLLLSAHERIRVDERAWKDVESYEDALLATIHQVRAVCDRLPRADDEAPWIKRLIRVHEVLDGAVIDRSPDHAGAAVTLLTRVLDTEPSRLNRRLVELVRALDLGPLRTALDEVRFESVENPLVNQTALNSGVDELVKFAARFRILAEEHDTWQRFDADLRVAEASLAQSLVQLEIIWAKLGLEVIEKHQGRTEHWAVTLIMSAKQLDDLICSKDARRAADLREAFRNFRRYCATRFYNVDAELREECDKLAELGTQLQLLLRTVRTSSP